jgi:hypothetical protein
MRLFLGHLNIDKPELIALGLDTMVMDNNDALKRQGVKPTYKKALGFAPPQNFGFEELPFTRYIPLAFSHLRIFFEMRSDMFFEGMSYMATIVPDLP